MTATSAAELEFVARVTTRLQELLEHAGNVKSETTVEPPVPTSELAESVDALHDGYADDYDQTYRFFAVETAVRETFYNLIHSTEINDPAFVEVWNLLDIVLLCGDRGKCTPELVCWLLEELLDSQTTHGCRTVFDYLESRRERLAQKDFHKKNLIFLRSCNELLRRLSRAEDAIFCGRVFFFLFQTFPLGDKSSVNLRGEFHVENTTTFDVLEQRIQDSDANQMDVDANESSGFTGKGERGALVKEDGKSTVAKTSSKKAVAEEVLSSSELYPVFWRLQHDFSDPTRLYEKENFVAFQSGLEKTIAKFKNTPTVVQTKAAEEDKRRSKSTVNANGGNADDDDLLLDNYNPKYLTSPDLFDLELSDLAFQRHILVQSLILIDFLLSLTEKAKKRLAALPSVNKSMLYNFTLSDEDTKWAIATRSTITAYLCLTQEGRQYCRMVETVLARDKNWVRWKVESCPPIVQGPVSTEEELAARSGAREAVRPRRVPDKPMGAMNLSFLSEGKGGGLEALKNPARYTVPSIEELVDGVRTDRLDAEMAMDDEEKLSFENAMANKKWRALRQARATNLGLLDKVQAGKDLDETFDHVEEANNVDTGGDDAGPNATLPISAEEPTPVATAPDDKPAGGSDEAS